MLRYSALIRNVTRDAHRAVDNDARATAEPCPEGISAAPVGADEITLHKVLVRPPLHRDTRAAVSGDEVAGLGRGPADGVP